MKKSDCNHNHQCDRHVSNNKNRIRTPRQERSIRTKTQIVDAAMKLFSEKGYHNTNSKEIASEAGVATGCFYSYYTDKLEVFKEVLLNYMNNFNAIINDYMSHITNLSIDRKQMIKGLIQNIISAHDFFAGLHNELISMRMEEPEIEKLLLEKEKSSIQLAYNILLIWKSEIKAVNLEAASVIIFTVIHRMVDLIVLKQTDISEELLIDETADMIIKYLFS